MFYLAQKYLKIRMASRRFPGRLWVNGGISLNVGEGSFRKCHLIRTLLKKSSKSVLSSGTFILFWIGAKSKPFSNSQISVSVKTFLLKLKTVSEQKYPTKQPSFVTLILELLKERFQLLGCWWLMETSYGEQAEGCLANWSISSYILRPCNSSKIERNSLSCVEEKFSSVKVELESFLIWAVLV